MKTDHRVRQNQHRLQGSSSEEPWQACANVSSSSQGWAQSLPEVLRAREIFWSPRSHRAAVSLEPEAYFVKMTFSYHLERLH